MDTDELQAQPLVRVEILADRIAGFLAMSPDSPRLVGADAAARWVAGRTTDRPIKQGSIVATSWSVREEMHMAAIMQRRASTSETIAYALGAGAVLEWSAGLVEGVPRWLIHHV